MKRLRRLAFLAATLPAALTAQANCRWDTPATVTHLPMPGTPFQAIASNDGCWIYVSLMRELRMPNPGPAAIALLRRGSGTARLERTIPLDQSPRGMVETHDGKLLIVAADSSILFIDLRRATSGDSNAVAGALKDGHGPYRILANVTHDDHWLFVSDERAQSITVVDLAAARRNGFGPAAIVGKIPTGIAPIALELSPDERHLYSTSERAPERFGWPVVCKPEGTNSAARSSPGSVGTVSVIDVERATRDPAQAVLSTVRAGCSPVRLALSPKGDIAYVTARNSNALLIFDTAKLLSDTAHALIDSIPAGTAPVGVTLVEAGRRLVVASSNRFNGDSVQDQTLAIVDVADARSRHARVIGEIPAGVFPRELHATPDGRTLLVTNFTSRSVELVPLPLDWAVRPRAPSPSTEQAILIRNDRVHVMRLTHAPRQFVRMHYAPPSTLTFLTDAHFEWIWPDGKRDEVSYKAGDVAWFAGGLHASQSLDDHEERIIVTTPVDDPDPARADGDPFIGTFTAPNGLLKVTFTREGEWLAAEVADRETRGEPRDFRYRARFDGKEYPFIAPANLPNTIVLERRTRNVIVQTERMNGRVISVDTYVLAPGGQSMQHERLIIDGGGHEAASVGLLSRSRELRRRRR